MSCSKCYMRILQWKMCVFMWYNIILKNTFTPLINEIYSRPLALYITRHVHVNLDDNFGEGSLFAQNFYNISTTILVKHFKHLFISLSRYFVIVLFWKCIRIDYFTNNDNNTIKLNNTSVKCSWSVLSWLLFIRSKL